MVFYSVCVEAHVMSQDSSQLRVWKWGFRMLSEDQKANFLYYQILQLSYTVQIQNQTKNQRNEQLLTSNSWPDLICKINVILLLRQREHRLFTYFQRVYVKCGDLDITNEVIFQANYKYFNEYLAQVIIPEKYQPIFFQFPKVGKKICRAHKEFQLKVKDKLNLYTQRMNEMVSAYHENMVQPVFSIHEGILKLNLNSQVFTCYQTLKQAQFVNRKMNQNQIVIVNTFLTTKMHYDQLHEQISLFYSKKLNNALFDDLLKPLRMNFIRNVNAGVSQVNWTSTKLLTAATSLQPRPLEYQWEELQQVQLELEKRKRAKTQVKLSGSMWSF
ncbi:Hypothetical_protein [Hexamita inflata]|uniref:Hypothetical_protein n=1 Tax=Hexamita inflata TaxID=28002 RepID=A0AA86R017_9EUKA|nr:Hypothetical protein HINF_LOCUS16952 [Hexamita inflata]CAI9962959.1 Hypothetical protein HINF_LOCUS50604 [Hexamita inflata]CAI9962963.1 Hypothetical protein HINF_LOCUS50608 [Hexamita inflata]